MIKEIEVGGVKHGITLADDMVGRGLVSVDGGKIIVNTGSGLAFNSENALEVNTIAMVGSGLFATGGKFYVDAPSLIAFNRGLYFDGSGIAISGEAASTVLSGSGLIARSGLLQANVNTRSGLIIDENKISVNIFYRSSGLRLFFNSNGELDVTQD